MRLTRRDFVKAVAMSLVSAVAGLKAIGTEPEIDAPATWHHAASVSFNHADKAVYLDQVPYYSSGKICDAKMYHYCLSDEEIAAAWNDGLVAYWPLYTAKDVTVKT